MAHKITLNLPNAEYRKMEGESFSTLKHFLSGPKKYFQEKETPFRGNRYTKRGTAVHHFLQNSPHLVALHEEALDGPLDQAELKWYQETNGEGVVVSEEDLEICTKIELNSRENSKILEVREKGIVEASCFIEYEGIPLKGKIDALGDSWLADYKTSSQSILVNSFTTVVRTLDYDMQIFMYLLLSGNLEKFYDGKFDPYIIPCHTKPPFPVAIYKLSRDTIASGKAKFEKCIASYRKYVLNGVCYLSEVEEI